MTRIQIERWYRRYWDHLTDGMGCQPFGWDTHTMRILHPGFFAARERLRALWLAVPQKS